jgi:hypothetical protein
MGATTAARRVLNGLSRAHNVTLPATMEGDMALIIERETGLLDLLNHCRELVALMSAYKDYPAVSRAVETLRQYPV